MTPSCNEGEPLFCNVAKDSASTFNAAFFFSFVPCHLLLAFRKEQGGLSKLEHLPVFIILMMILTYANLFRVFQVENT